MTSGKSSQLWRRHASRSGALSWWQPEACRPERNSGCCPIVPPMTRAETEIARQALISDVSGTHKIDGVDWFLHVYNPPYRIVIVGAVHIAQALVQFSTACGYATTVVDPRRSFASDERFPNVAVSTAWPDEAMDEFRPDARTAVVTLTHDPKLDDPALDRALKSEAFYIGALGSRRTHAARRNAFANSAIRKNRWIASRDPSD